MKSSWKKLWMLVSVLVLVGSLAGCGLFGDDDDNGEEEDPKTVTVYFYNSEGWDEVYAYSDDVEGMGDPGEEADEDSDADDWYTIEIERDVLRDPMDVVFHNNDGEEADSVTIDHPNQVYVTAKGDVFGSMGGVEDEMNATLYFYNSEEWDNVHVQSDDIDALSDNPEVDEDPDNEDWYSVTVPVNLTDNPISVTFNDGDVSTGTELNLDDHSKTYLTVLEDGIYSSMDSAESAISGVSTTVYFYNTGEWDDVYAWAWTDDGDIFESWPGEPAEEVEDQDGWYSIDLPGIESTDSLEIIFNNNDGDDTIQTDDTPFASEDDLYVVFEGDGEVASTYESFDEAESASEQVTFELWFYNDQGWDSVYVDAEDDNEESVLDGAEATRDGDTDWWSIEVPADLEEVDVDVTFHDNDGSEGDTITIEDEDEYYLTSDKDVMYQGRTKVYFNNEDEWTDVYADVETDEDTPESFLTDVEAIQDGESDWYFVDIPVNFSDDDYTITFHDGDTEEAPAAELTDSSDKYITMTEDETYSTLNQAEAWMGAASDDFVTVYYYNSEGWDLENINAYNWSTVDSLNEVLGAWPGMSVEEDPDDSDWVMIDVPLDFDDISGEDDTFTMIFNNGDGEQTPDIELTDDTELFTAYNGNTYEDKDAAEESMASTEVTFYNTDEWNTVYADAENDSESLLSDAEATQDGDSDWWTIEVPTSLAIEDVDLTFHDGSDNEVEVTLTDGDNLIINMDGISEYETRALNELYYEQDTSEYTNVYFYNAGDWSDVKAYAWNDDDDSDKPFGEWPGSPAFTDDDDDDWLHIGADWDLDTDSYSIIFNGDDEEIQTEDISLPDSTDVYITPYGTAHESKADAEAAVEDEASTEVHFYNSEDWSNVHAWAWDGDGNLLDGDWPGPEMTDSNDDDWYTIDIPKDAWLNPFSMLVNDGGDPATQTEDFTIDNTDDLYIVLDGDTNDNGHLTIEQFDNSSDAEASLTD